MRLIFIFQFIFFFFCCVEGSWAQELRTGTYPDGTLRYKGYFVDGKPTGKIVRYNPDGKIKAEMNYRGDTVEVVLYSKDGAYKSQGKYVNQKKCGTWEHKKDEHILMREEYRDNYLHGKSFRYDASGKLIEEKGWLNGKADGKWNLYYEEGPLRMQAVFITGKLEGAVKSYGRDGKLRVEGNYKNNLKEGIWAFYDVTGELLKKQVYHAGISEQAEEEEIEENRKLDELLLAGQKIPDPAVFADDPEAYMRLMGME